MKKNSGAISETGRPSASLPLKAKNKKPSSSSAASSNTWHTASIPYDEIAIFYRTNAQSRTFEDALLSRRIPYVIIGGLSFYQRKEIKDILSFLRVLVSGSDLVSFLRTINLPKRGLGPATLDAISKLSASLKLPILTLCEEILSAPHQFPDLKLSSRQKTGLGAYLQLIHSLREKQPNLRIHELIAEIISASNYRAVLEEDPESSDDRKENLDELIGKAAEWEEERETPTLQHFLEELSLRQSSDEQKNIPSVRLMTIHNSKGLEFELVFLVGLEEELFPHMNSLGSAESLEEERRLCYVGMTRAKRYLYLTAAAYRYIWGTPRLMQPSRFLREIPSRYLKNYSPTQYESAAPILHDPEGFAQGTKIYHREFGSGTIQKVYHTSFGLTYEIRFDATESTRSIVAKYAKLQPLS